MMTSISDSRRPAKGDPDSKSIHSSEDAVDSEAASMVFDSDGVQLSGVGGEGVQKYTLPESRKIGVAGAFFLILNKMIGTGSEFFFSSFGLIMADKFKLLICVVSVFSTPSGIFASTGSVGICLLMWAVGK